MEYCLIGCLALWNKETVNVNVVVVVDSKNCINENQFLVLDIKCCNVFHCRIEYKHLVVVGYDFHLLQLSLSRAYADKHIYASTVGYLYVFDCKCLTYKRKLNLLVVHFPKVRIVHLEIERLFVVCLERTIVPYEHILSVRCKAYIEVCRHVLVCKLTDNSWFAHHLSALAEFLYVQKFFLLQEIFDLSKQNHLSVNIERLYIFGLVSIDNRKNYLR